MLSPPVEEKEKKSSALDTVKEALEKVLPSTAESAEDRDKVVGTIGVLHPQVLKNLGLIIPVRRWSSICSLSFRCPPPPALFIERLDRIALDKSRSYSFSLLRSMTKHFTLSHKRGSCVIETCSPPCSTGEKDTFEHTQREGRGRDTMIEIEKLWLLCRC